MRPAFGVYKTYDTYYSGGFEQLLRQERALYTVSDRQEAVPVTCFEGYFPSWAYDYVKKGNVAVVSGVDRLTFNFEVDYVCKAVVEYIDLSEFNQGQARICSAVSVFLGEGKGELTLHENRSIKKNRRPGFYPLFIYKKYGEGTIIYTGAPLSEVLTYEGSTLRQTSDVLDFDERISSVDKAKVKVALREVLKEAMNLAGYPYVSLWYYPFGVRSVFGYSIDGDGLLSDGVDNLLKVAHDTNTKFVFYINEELCADDEGLKDKLKRISENNIVAVHGAIHNGKDSYEDNLADLEEFDQWMSELGIEYVKSYAAPRGMYCRNLGKALKNMGYLHSRDFGFAVDDQPYFPLNEGREEAPLQIPCDGFNICRWMLKNEELGLEMPTAEEIIASYKKLIDLKLERKQPLLFFCHPQYFGLYAKEVYPELVSYVEEKGVLLMDFVAFGDFWLERDRSTYDADFVNAKLQLKKKDFSDSVKFCVNDEIYEMDQKKEVIFTMDEYLKKPE